MCQNDKGNLILIVTGTSKPSKKSTWEAYGSHIKAGSKIIHDDEHSHSILVERLNLESEVYPSSETKGLEDDDNPLKLINEIHRYLKIFFRDHGGYSREDLQDWLNLLWFIFSKPYDKYDKVLKFIEMAILALELVRYRDVMRKNHDKQG